MTIRQKQKAVKLFMDGNGYKAISKELDVSINTIKSFLRRNGLKSKNTYIGKCEYCGIRIEQEPGRKAKKFCSDKCRTAWWKKQAKEMHDDE